MFRLAGVSTSRFAAMIISALPIIRNWSVQHARVHGNMGLAPARLILSAGTLRHIMRWKKRWPASPDCPARCCFPLDIWRTLGAATALLGHGDAIFCDKLNHASLNDAALLSRAKFSRYSHCPHLDLAALERQLAESHARRKLILTDAVFSMDGDIAPVPGLLELCEKYDAWLMLDDAHGFGVLGPQGRGTLAHFNIRSPRIIYMATLGKAAGVFGAFVAAQPEIIETLIQHARSYIYTTAAPPLLSHTLLKSLKLIEEEEWRREKLAQLVERLKHELNPLRWRLLPSVTPIQPLVIGENDRAVEVSEALRDRGILVPAIRPPTVPQGAARLRISLSASHTMEDLARLGEALGEVSGELDRQHLALVRIISLHNYEPSC